MDGVHRQLDEVRDALGADLLLAGGVLCFVDADWPVIGGAFRTRNIDVVWPRRLRQMITAPSTRPAYDIEDVCRRLDAAFPRA